MLYEAIGVGQTRVDWELTWGSLPVRYLSFDVYVGLKPSLTAYPQRGSCYWCDGSDFLDSNKFAFD